VRALLAFGVVLLLGAVVAPLALAQDGGFAPVDAESPSADGIRDSFLFVSIFTGAILLLVEVTLVVFIVRYRRRRRDRFADGPQVHGATNLELLWTALPVLVLFLIGAFVFYELPGITNVPSAGASGERIDVRVTGRQFYWQYDYENGATAIDTLRAPAGVPVRLQVTATDEDVIHSWWIPALGGKIDAIPGVVNETWFEAEQPGTYDGQCAELCGVEHANMLASAQVMDADEFDAWVAERAADTSELGEEEWTGACAKCHGSGGEGGVGPRIGGSPTLSDAEALEDVVRNGRGAMPPVGSHWSEEQMDALTTYLRETPPSGG
jgi:cytochrome c oxidase subunit 2